MRKSITATLMVTTASLATASLILLGGAALAQNSSRNRGSSTTGTSQQATPNIDSGGPLEAPIGHRQPRIGDVPSEKGLGNVDPEDAALDRRIKSICRGC